MTARLHKIFIFWDHRVNKNTPASKCLKTIDLENLIYGWIHSVN